VHCHVKSITRLVFYVVSLMRYGVLGCMVRHLADLYPYHLVETFLRALMGWDQRRVIVL
jgi:hypothetical protein